MSDKDKRILFKRRTFPWGTVARNVVTTLLTSLPLVIVPFGSVYTFQPTEGGSMRAHYLSLADRIRGALYAILAVSLTLFLFVTFCLHVHGVM